MRNSIYNLIIIYALMFRELVFDDLVFEMSNLPEMKGNHSIKQNKTFYQNDFVNRSVKDYRIRNNFHGCRNSRICKNGLQKRLENSEFKKRQNSFRKRDENFIQYSFKRNVKSNRYQKRHPKEYYENGQYL
jgi:hypothetical protein